MVMLCLSSNAFAFSPKLVVSKKPSGYDFDGEVLKFSALWSIFHIANIETDAKRIDGVYKFSDRITTAGVASWFKHIDDRNLTIWDSKLMVPLSFCVSQNEGSYHRVKLYTVNLKDNTITYVKRKKGKKDQVKLTKVIPTPFTDPISGIYFFRKYGIFKIGAKTVFPVYTEGKFFNASMKVISEEKVSTPIGDIETYKCEPSSELMPKGDFQKEGTFYIWFTTDERHIPVKLEGKVKIGHITAVITSAEGRKFNLENGIKRRERSWIDIFKSGKLRGD